MSKNYILAPYVTIGLTSNSLKLGFGSIQTEILDTNIINAIIDLCKYILEPKKFDEIKFFLSNYKNLSDKDIQYIITVLIEKHLLLEFELYNKCDRYSRQMLFYNMYSDDPIGIHKRIKKSKIIICGCGGIGSNIAVMLATMGVNDLILIDDDIIEESNLSRQFMYCENDLGLYKVDVLERELIKRDSTLKIKSIKLKFDKSIEYIGTADLIVLSGDSFGICKEINSFSYKKLIYLL